jgi:hypothetical protein
LIAPFSWGLMEVSAEHSSALAQATDGGLRDDCL